MSPDTVQHQRLPTARQRNRARLRLAFGLLQIMGASAGLYLLLRTGLTLPTVIVVAATLAISLTSRIIFTRPSPQR